MRSWSCVNLQIVLVWCRALPYVTEIILKWYWNKHLGISWRQSGTENSGSWEDPEAHSSKKNHFPNSSLLKPVVPWCTCRILQIFQCCPARAFQLQRKCAKVSLHQLPRGALAHCVLEKKNVCVILFEYSKGMTALQHTLKVWSIVCLLPRTIWWLDLELRAKNSPSLLWLNCIRRHSSCNGTPFGSAQRDLSKLKWTAMVAQESCEVHEAQVWHWQSTTYLLQLSWLRMSSRFYLCWHRNGIEQTGYIV